MSLEPFGINLLRNSGVATLARILGRSVGYIVQIILARILLPDTFGLFAIGWTILRLFTIAGHLGLDYGVIHFGSRYWQKDDIGLKSVFALSLIGAFASGLIFGLLLYLLAPWLSIEFFKKPELKTILQGFAFTFPLATSLRILAATSSISKNMLFGGIAEDVVQPLFQIILLFAFISTGSNSISAVIFSTIFSYIIAVTFGFAGVKRLVPKALSIGKISTQDAFALFSFSLPTIIAVTLAAFNLWGDRLIVGYFGSETQTGIYQSISIITMITTTILSGIKITIAPIISQTFYSGEIEKLHSMGKMITRWTLYFSTPILLVTAIAPREIITIAFGLPYQSGSTALFWLTIGQLFYVTYGLGDQFFLLTGKNKDWLIIATSIFILTIGLDALFIPRLGLIGAALVSCAMMMLMGLLSLFRLKQILHFWLFDRQHIKIWVAALNAGLITLAILHFLVMSTQLKLLAAFIISGFFFVIFLIIYGFSSEDKRILGQMIKIPLKIIK
jgi:O-antigen/teichoic acid export membrane protein